MKEVEVRNLVRREIDTIRKAESGVLPPTPHVVLEVIRRHKTMKHWDGLPATTPIPMALRAIVEEILKGTPRPIRVAAADPYDYEPEDFDLKAEHPLVMVERLGAKSHRHLREIPMETAV